MEATLFDFPKLEITNKIRLIELFGGIGSQAMALRDIGANFEHYRLVEFDKYAVASYNAIHGTNFKPTDIRSVHGLDLGITNKQSFTYLLTYSFPCQSLSVAGKMEGMSKKDWENGNSTRSGLLWEVERILKELRAEELPQVLLMENVPQVHAEQNRADFEAWLAFLRSRGYFNFYQDLNAKDYGIPQNRDRCFCVSILSPEFIDYEFPNKTRLNSVVKDFLENKVDEKYYINNEKAKKLLKGLEDNEELEGIVKEAVDGTINDPRIRNISNAITTRISASGICNHKQESMAVVEIRQATKEGTIKCKVGGCYDASFPESATPRGRVQEGGDVVPTLTAGSNENIRYVETIYRIRKLTPRECWRLMGYTDEDYDKAAFEKKELYIQGGNDKCNAKLKVVQEKPILTDTESFVSCTTSDIKSMETLKIIKKLLAEMPESERTQNVNFVITKSEGLEHLECATNTTKCITFMGMRCILTEEKDQLVMVITEQGKEVKQNTAKSMKITTESNLDQSKLYTILILTELIMKSGIYGCTTLQASIQGNIAITDVCENSIRLKISDLKMESTSVRVSSSQLYKQAGNAIVKQVLMAIFAQMIPESARQK